MALSHNGFLGSRLSGRALEIGVCAMASSGFFLLGHDQGVMSGIITEPIFLRTFPQMAQTNNEGAIQALVVAIYEIGCLFGALFIVAYGDKIGRRKAVLLGAFYYACRDSHTDDLLWAGPTHCRTYRDRYWEWYEYEVCSPAPPIACFA